MRLPKLAERCIETVLIQFSSLQALKNIQAATTEHVVVLLGSFKRSAYILMLV